MNSIGAFLFFILMGWVSEEEQPRLIPDSEVPEPDMVKEGYDPGLGFLDWVRERFKRKHEYKPPREPSEPWPDPPQGYQPKTGLDQGKPAPFNDGGLIYPRQVLVGPDGTIRGYSNPGMTLLQHYAGLAMQGLLIADDSAALEAIASMALKQAQAMIEAEAKLREVE